VRKKSEWMAQGSSERGWVRPKLVTIDSLTVSWRKGGQRRETKAGDGTFTVIWRERGEDEEGDWGPSWDGGKKKKKPFVRRRRPGKQQTDA